MSEQATAQTPASWINPASGTWADASNWSTSPFSPQNGNPSGSLYDASIGAAGAPYVVTLNSNASVNSVNVSGPSAQLLITGGTLSASTINITNGAKLAFNYGTLSQSTITGDSVTLGSYYSQRALLNAVTIATSVRATGASFYNGLTLSGPNGVFTADGTLPDSTTGPDVSFFGTQSISGSGTMVLNGDTAGVGAYPFATQAVLTIGQGITVTSGTLDGGFNSASAATGKVLNKGTIWAQSGRMLIDGVAFTNQGTLLVSPGASLWLNAGSYSTSDIGTIIRSGGTVAIGGGLYNTGQVLEINASTGSYQFSDGSITGGTIRSRDGMVFTAGYGLHGSTPITLDNVILDAVVTEGPGSSGIRIINGLTMTPGSRITATALNFDGMQSVTGSGELSRVNVIGGTLTLGAGITSAGVVGNSNQTVEGASVVNNGTINANGFSFFGFANIGGNFRNNGTIQVGPGQSATIAGTWRNDGTILQDSGTLELAGSFTTSDIGILQRTSGALNISGTLNNQGNTLLIDSHTGSITFLKFGSINGGTVETRDGAKLVLTPSSSNPSTVTLNNVTLKGEALYSAPGSWIDVHGGLRLDNGSLTIAAIGSTLAVHAGSGVGITGNGTVFFGGTTSDNVLAGYQSDPLIIDSNIVVQSASQGGTIGLGFSSFTVDNHGIIWSATTGKQMAMDGTWTNHGTFKLDAGTLLLGGTFTPGDIGTVQRTGGFLTIGGWLANAGTTLLSDSSMGSIIFVKGTVSGGSLGGGAGHPFFVGSKGVIFSGTTVDAEVNLLNGASLLLNNATLTGKEIRLSSSGSLTSLDVNNNSLASASPGTITFAGTSGANQVLQQSGTLLIPTSLTVRNDGTGGGTLGESNLVVRNNGTVSAQSAGAPIYVFGTSIINAGLLEAKNGGSLVVQNLTGNAGTVSAGPNGGVKLTGTYTINQPTNVFNGASLSLAGSWSNTATLSINNTSTLIAGGTWANNSAVRVDQSTLKLTSLPSPFGVISLASSTLSIAVPMTTAQVKAFVYSNATISIESGGVINNVGTAIPLDGSLGSAWQMNGGTISGGSLTGNVAPFSVATAGTLNTVSINSRIDVLPGASLNLTNLWTSSGTIAAQNAVVHLGGTPANIGTILITDGTLGIRGTITTAQSRTPSLTNSLILLEGGTINNSGATLSLSSDGPFQFLNGIVTGGAITSSGASLSVLGSISLEGVAIQAPVAVPAAGTLRLRSTWHNQSTITLNNGSLLMQGTFATADLGAIARTGGTIALSGALDNTSATLKLAQLGTLLLATGTINGGTISGSSLAPLTLDNSIGTLNNVTIAAPVIPGAAAQLNFLNGATLAGATVGSGLGTMNFRGTQVLGGDGTLIASAQGIRVPTGSLTIASGVSVINPLAAGSLGGGSDIILNQGLISARGLSGTLNLAGNFTNQGTVEARDGRVLNILGAPTNYSIGTLTGGAWIAGANSTIALGSSTITTNNATVTLNGVGSTFAPVNQIRNNLGAFTVTNARDFNSVGSLTNTGTIVVGPGSTLNVVDSFNNLAGLLDLNFKMIVDYSGTSPLDEFEGEIGSQIISSAVIADPSLAIGSIDDGDAVRLQITTAGDANLDGVVDYDDLSALSSHYSQDSVAANGLAIKAASLNHLHWADGDFNYDGTVNLTDLYALGWQYKDTDHPLDTSLTSLGLPHIDVPEPALLGALSLLTAMQRRRRQII